VTIAMLLLLVLWGAMTFMLLATARTGFKTLATIADKGRPVAPSACWRCV
jgi:hypothetical protein